MKKNEEVALKLLNLVKKEDYDDKTKTLWEMIFRDCRQEIQVNTLSCNTCDHSEFITEDELSAKNIEIANLKAMSLVTEAYNRQMSIINQEVANDLNSMADMIQQSKNSLDLRIKRPVLINRYIKSFNDKQRLQDQLARELRLILDKIRRNSYELN